jgi:hypothetical protein
LKRERNGTRAGVNRRFTTDSRPDQVESAVPDNRTVAIR